jgi:pimeloyl-ACP methyl ester carboxylesterase
LGSDVFADLYLPEGAARSRPLLVYFAGALDERRYEERRRGEPSNVLDEFRFAVGQAGWGLLVVPPPPALTEIGPALRLEVAGLVDAFVEEAGWRPLTIATVGMSYGAMLGCALTLEAPRCNRLATLAGVGMKEVVEAAAPDAVAGKAFRCFVNEGDPLSEQSHRFAALMASAGRSVEVVSRKGEHSFADFVANGLAIEAFRFAAGLIQG